MVHRVQQHEGSYAFTDSFSGALATTELRRERLYNPKKKKEKKESIEPSRSENDRLLFKRWMPVTPHSDAHRLATSYPPPLLSRLECFLQVSERPEVHLCDLCALLSSLNIRRLPGRCQLTNQPRPVPPGHFAVTKVATVSTS